MFNWVKNMYALHNAILPVNEPRVAGLTYFFLFDTCISPNAAVYYYIYYRWKHNKIAYTFPISLGDNAVSRRPIIFFYHIRDQNLLNIS